MEEAIRNYFQTMFFVENAFVCIEAFLDFSRISMILSIPSKFCTTLDDFYNFQENNFDKF